MRARHRLHRLRSKSRALPAVRVLRGALHARSGPGVRPRRHVGPAKLDVLAVQPPLPAAGVRPLRQGDVQHGAASALGGCARRPRDGARAARRRLVLLQRRRLLAPQQRLPRPDVRQPRHHAGEPAAVAVHRPRGLSARGRAHVHPRRPLASATRAADAATLTAPQTAAHLPALADAAARPPQLPSVRGPQRDVALPDEGGARPLRHAVQLAQLHAHLRPLPAVAALPTAVHSLHGSALAPPPPPSRPPPPPSPEPPPPRPSGPPPPSPSPPWPRPPPAPPPPPSPPPPPPSPPPLPPPPSPRPSPPPYPPGYHAPPRRRHRRRRLPCRHRRRRRRRRLLLRRRRRRRLPSRPSRRRRRLPSRRRRSQAHHRSPRRRRRPPARPPRS